MIKRTIFIFLLLQLCFSFTQAQVPIATQVQIVKAEDARRYDAALEVLLKHPHYGVRTRALLAAGRIGDERALEFITPLLEKGTVKEREMTAFAFGEIESIKAAGAILNALGGTSAISNAPKFADSPRTFTRLAGTEKPASAISPQITARLLEAAGKIAAANASDPKSKELGAAIVIALEAELKKSPPSTEVCRLGLTAVLRSRPAGSEETVRKFLALTDPEIVATALNTLARLRAKNANRDARDLLETHVHAVVRANAARVLGAADDKEAVDILIKAAMTDTDSRVRVAAIRSLGAIKVMKSAEPLLARGEALLEAYKKSLKPNFIPVEQNEFIEVSNAIGQVLAKTGNARAIALFRDFAKVDNFKTTEPYIARVKVGGIRPGSGIGSDTPPTTYRQYSTLSQLIGELATYEPESDEAKKIKDEAPAQIRQLLTAFLGADPKVEPEAVKAAPDALQAFAKFKTADLGEITRTALQNADVQTRAAAAGVLADLPPSKENIDALEAALSLSLNTDQTSDDAQIAIIDALGKFDGLYIMRQAYKTLDAPNFLVRRKTAEVLISKGVNEDPQMRPLNARVYPLKAPQKGELSKLGVLLNTDVDYRRAVSRKNGTVSAVFTTEKGNFTIDFLPEDAPLTVDNFIKLARAGYFNGLEVHRVVPNFVMQDGDPRGDGNGGPGWSIRCEVNMVPYDRGAVGMALSGKDTGGSQWFVTHSPQPHLDGGYTVFGRVNETGMKVIDNIVRGDKIINVRIVGK